MPIEKEPLRRFFRCGEDRPLKMQKIRPPLRWPGEVPISQVMTCMKLKNTPKKTSSPKKICMNLGEWTSRGLIHIQREAQDSRRPFPSIRWYHVFWERNIKRGFLALLWYQKDTTYVVHFADASIKGLFSDSPFLFFECISTIKTSAETVTSVTCFGSTVILPNDSEWGF